METLIVIILLGLIILVLFVALVIVNKKNSSLKGDVKVLQESLSTSSRLLGESKQKLHDVKGITGLVLKGKVPEYATANGKVRGHLVAGLKVADKLINSI